MSEHAQPSVAVTLNVAPAVSERLLDWLLGRGEAGGFTTSAAYGHGANHDDLSIAEQVTGRQRRVEVRLELAATALEPFLVALRGAFAGADIHYFVTPVLRSGDLRNASR